MPPAPAQPSKTFAQAVQDSETLTPAASAAASPVTPAAQAVKVTVETPALVSAPASPTASSFLAATVPSSPAVVAVAPAVAATPQQHTTPTLTHARPIQWAHDSRRILLVGEAGVGEHGEWRGGGGRLWGEALAALFGLTLLATAVTTLFVFTAAAIKSAGERG